MARAAGVGLAVDKRKIVTQDIVLRICDLFGIDPFRAISEGTLVAAVEPRSADTTLGALASAGIAASIVGELTPVSSGVIVTDETGTRELEHPKIDPFWGTFEEYLAKQAARRATPGTR